MDKVYIVFQFMDKPSSGKNIFLGLFKQHLRDIYLQTFDNKIENFYRSRYF